MWAVHNLTRFKTDRTFARDADGAEIFVVAVRATLAIGSDGAVVVAENQQDVCLAPSHFGEPESSSLRYDADLVRTKPGTDVVLHALAHSADERPVPFVDVGFRVGPMVKKLRVVGDRVWERSSRGVSPGSPLPFITMPICYERAWGGKLPQSEARDPGNPVGVGRCAVPGEAVPNCELVEDPIQSPSHDGPPAGFGPIACHWLSRSRFAGTFDDAWKRERRPLVPRDFSDAYFRCAPLDQQIDGFLQGGEEVVLFGLSPEGLLRFRLPRISIGFSTRISGGIEHHRGELHTVVIEPEQQRLVMVWQTALPCHNTLYSLEETVVFEKERLRSEPGDPTLI
jgi:hypothetical protein